MADTIQNLWPTDFGETAVLTPVAILRQQAMALGQRTQNIVVGRVETSPNGEGFLHSFRLHCSPLGYSTQLFAVIHSIDLYPVQINVYGETTPPQRVANNSAEFEKQLKDIFAKEKTKKIIASLMAQSKQ